MSKPTALRKYASRHDCKHVVLPKGAIELLSNACAINSNLTTQEASINMSMVCAKLYSSQNQLFFEWVIGHMPEIRYDISK